MAPAKHTKVQFHFLNRSFSFRDRTKLKSFLVRQLSREGIKSEAINFIFCNDAYLLELNKTHLKHNTLTDIITFELSVPGEPLIADIYISVERVRENAQVFKTPFVQEIHRVIFHGVLHLCGLKDKSSEEKKQMRAMEDLWISRYFKK
jgi:probable rRNA maturation factor